MVLYMTKPFAATVAATVAQCILYVSSTGSVVLLISSIMLAALFNDRKPRLRRRYSTHKHCPHPSLYVRVSTQDVWVWSEGKRSPQDTCMDFACPRL